MNNRFVVKTTLSKEDTAALAKQQLRKNKLFMLACSLLLIVGAAVNWVRNGDNKMMIAVAAVVLFVISLVMDKLIAMAMFRNANKAAGETTYTVTDADIFMHCDLREGGIPYNAFTDLVETEKYFFLYIQKRAAFIFPKKDFVEGEIDAFRKFISRKTEMNVRRVRG